VTEQMIENMFIGKPPGNYDRILDFSRAVTGTLFFVPSATFLDALGEEASTDATPAARSAAAPATAASDGSLGIGSLKGEMDP
jgi:putative iron-dependent peroxidase